MSTIDRRVSTSVPPLVAGQLLDRATFHECYEQMPPNIRAELIGGVVYMPSPLSYEHGRVNTSVVSWLSDYEKETPGVVVTINNTTMLADRGETQPDTSMLILPECGGRTRIEGRYLAGPPELVVEIALTSRAVDLGPKLREYERTGVMEYLVVAAEPDEIFWFGRRDARPIQHELGEDGVIRSEVFPGLWLDAQALFRRDWDRLGLALSRGLASPEHAAFVERLARLRG